MATEVIVINDTEHAVIAPVKVSIVTEPTIEGEPEPKPLHIQAGTSEISLDAWGRQKVYYDHSLFNSIFTYNVPNRNWEEVAVDAADGYTILTGTGVRATSEDGALKITSGTVADEGTALLSKRHPRYQPNRGHLYSTAGWFPNPTADGFRKWGLMCGCLSDSRRTGVYFELEGNGSSSSLYVVLRSMGVIRERVDITSALPVGFDLSKGALYDIQFQWRGVGNFNFFVNQKLVHTMEFLQESAGLTLWNPSLSVAFEAVTNTTTAVEMRFGCVDITSEGGESLHRKLNSVTTGETLLDVDNSIVPVLGLKVPRTLSYNGEIVVNTRDAVLSQIISWTRDESGVYVYLARDVGVPNLEAIAWEPMYDTPIVKKVGGKYSDLDTAFNLDKNNMLMVLHEWSEIDTKNKITNPEMDSAPFSLSAGDILIVAVKSLAGTDENSSTLYLSEEI